MTSTTKVAAIDCGYWNKDLTRHFANLDGLGAVYDPEPQTQEKFATEFGVPGMSFDEMLDSELAEDEPLKLECKHFMDCVASGETLPTDGYEGLHVLRILQATQDVLDAERG